ncbi:MAG: carboxy-S-adenosyl-L-methionine synthase CmoA [Pseudomonadales bacterium]
MRDTIYANNLDNIAGFRFDESVAAVFPDMLQRSIPGYSNIITMTGLLATRHAQDNSRCYDLGCSLGASTLAMAAQLNNRPITFVAVDNSKAMLTRCADALSSLSSNAKLELLCENLQDTPINNASVVVLNFTLQFVPLAERERVLQNIYEGLLPNGAVILSEKICFENAEMQALTTELYHDFKMTNGYSALEVSQKRTALENVLIPETLAAHEARLRKAGFQTIGVWFQCFNFISLVAIK